MRDPRGDPTLARALRRMAHQIKNPLQALTVNLEVIRGRVGEEAPEAWKGVERFAGAVDANVRLLDRRLGLLLALAGRGEDDAPTEVDAAALVRDFAAALRFDEEAPGVRVEGSADMAARVRSGWLLALLLELWDAALEAGAEETPVTVRGEGHEVRLAVSIPSGVRPDVACLEAAARHAGGRLEAAEAEDEFVVVVDLPTGGPRR